MMVYSSRKVYPRGFKGGTSLLNETSAQICIGVIKKQWRKWTLYTIKCLAEVMRVVVGYRCHRVYLEYPFPLTDGAINPRPFHHTVVRPELVHALSTLLVADPCAAVYVACRLGNERGEGKGRRATEDEKKDLTWRVSHL